MTSLSEALAPKSDQLNADDLIAGPRTIKITGAKIVRSERQMRITLNYEGDQGKPFKPCKTMGRAMVMVWGITDENYEQQFVGKSIRVYRDPEVKFGDQGAVGGIRISHMSHIDKPVTVKLTVSQGKKSNFVFQPLPGVVSEASPAQKWANAYIGQVAEITDAAALNEFANSKAKKLAELAGANAALHTECVTALDKRRAELAGFTDDDDPFGGPTEGKPDDQTGEGFTDGEAPYAATVTDIMARIDKAIGAASWEAAKDEYTKHMMALPREVAGTIEAALQAKKVELGL